MKLRNKINFNSIKVRLKLTIFSVFFLLLSNFNSIKVRLKQSHPGHTFDNLPYFNSIKVRLKHVLLINLCGLPIFQFHKGTIKTFYCVIIFNMYN